ncbi:MAG: hypothetical protein D6682_02420 [Zetaproteobacteria bacterium]|nr:MAG: hypothetical protein D6682_02420 [Zetaproteobacteria bacterium]
MQLLHSAAGHAILPAVRSLLLLLLLVPPLHADADPALDSARFHLAAADRYLADHQPARALAEYEAAIARDGQGFAGWLGKAVSLIRLKREAEARQALEEADDRQKGKQQKLALLRARLEYAVTFKPKHWLRSAKEAFFKARKIAPQEADLQLWIARAMRDGGKRSAARKHYSEAIAIGGPAALTATRELLAMLRQEAAAAGGKGAIAELAERPSVDRATLAAVLVDRLRIQQRFPRRKQHRPLPDDARNSPFASAIDTLLNLQIDAIEPDARGAFHPDRPVTRFELARLAEEYLVSATGDDELHRAFVGVPSPFPDLSSNHYAFNAAFLAVSRGLMAPPDPLTGAFAGDRPVRGVDLLLLLNRLGALPRSE